MIQRWFQTGNVFQDVHDIAILLNYPLLISRFTLYAGGRHQFQLLLVRRVGGVLGQLLEDVCARVAGDVQVVCQSGSVAARARERMLL